ncbi:hypothetical protein RHGRI_036102 [Rhododendron griersonianum]|uniref:RNase H type-1 domain-containing protein n=2 Tax=Rhododendron griersonianum TaxID=479676 RepID=A0AAV6HPP8_9ERIC|nr:hypothetical protein RHGRI_036102 [Rhododendron griersonianum]
MSLPQGQISEVDSQDGKAIASLICWSIWKNRNQDLFEGQQWEPLVVYEKAMLAWKEFKVTCDLLEQRAPPFSSPCTQIWQSPLEGYIKLNVDGALNSQDGNGGVGFVARNRDAILVGAAMEIFKGPLSPRVIEALGFRFALTTALHWGYSRIIVEGDALQIVQALNGSRSFVDCDTIILDCLQIAMNFSSCLFSHVKRGCNRVAHFVARKSLSGNGLMSWRGDFPQWLLTLALDDVRASGSSSMS